MPKSQTIRNNLERIKAEAGKCTLVAVTKYYPVDDVFMAYEAGHRDFGESRVQDLKKKSDELVQKGYNDVNWHFIGHLQTNKVNTLLKIPHLKYIHSVDSVKLLETLYSKSDLILSDKIDYFLQLKTTDEEEKHGIDGDHELADCLEFILDTKNSKFNFLGLMTIGKIRTEDFEQDARESFTKLKKYRMLIEKNYGMKNLKLSMGMSDDYKIALDEGSDFIRLGSILFD